MIFGFNTDIRHEDTVYHVQSEAREGDQLLQTQVFVRGRCVGKRAISYASEGEEKVVSRNPALINSTSAEPSDAEADSTAVNAGVNKDQYKEKLLRDLHRQVLDAIREGRLDSVLDKRETPDVLASVKELDVQWTNAESVHSHGALMMNLQVTKRASPSQGRG